MYWYILRKRFFWLQIMVAIVCVCGSAQGATITVGLGGSIQSAIDAASPGDVIEVQSGTYHENVNVDKPIILFGVDTSGGKGSAISLNASGSVLEGFVVTNSPDSGIRITSSDNVVRDNLVKGNDGYGILFENSSYNVITHNEIRGNLCGIGLQDSSQNAVFLNVVTDNGANVVSSNSTNQWNSTDPITYKYKGRTFTGRLGNHWSDYPGADLDDDGIGDVPHLFEAERDDAPLIMTGLRPEIMVDKVANVTSGAPGTVVKFVIEVTNVGEIEFDHVVVQDLLPDGLEYLGDDGNGTVQGQNVTWKIGPQTIDESKHVELLARISGTILGNITNHVKVAGILSTEYSLTDEDAESLEALIERVILTKGAKFSKEVVYVVPPPSAVSGEAKGNTHVTIPVHAGGGDEDFEKMYLIKYVIARAKDGDILEVCGLDPNLPRPQRRAYACTTVNKSLYLRGVVKDAKYPPTFDSGDQYSSIKVIADGCIIEGLKAIEAGRSYAGIEVVSNYNVIKDNIAEENYGVGFLFVSSKGNVVTGNTAEGNNRGTIRLVSSNDNIIYLNNFISGSTPHAWSDSKNTWNSPQKITYQYNGTTLETTGPTTTEVTMTAMALATHLITFLEDLYRKNIL